MATNVVINNQPRQSPTVISVQSNQWSTGICDCFDDLEICCFASWCLPCFACKTASDFGECFCLPLLDMVFLAFQMLLCPTCIPPVSMSMRVAVRHHYKIQGDMCGDCVYTTFCNICSWCQMAREIKRHKQSMTFITTQAVYTGDQQFLVTQPGVVASQPVMATAPQAILTSM
ncbi:cornifelin-like [Anabas testudineus]|nr:cornifelin-like [Anabas testudineus]XP_026209104.1 cornifelin-like [Anabas testudineus]